MDEIRRLKSLLVKHEKRIRALEARVAGPDSAPASANTSLVDSPQAPPAAPPANAILPGENHVTHDTNANVAKTATEVEMAPDEV